MSHSNTSGSECLQTLLRIIGPPYLKFTESDTIVSNLTTKDGPAPIVRLDRPHPLNIISIDPGLKFVDAISMNFTMTVDPDSERPVGAGLAKTVIAIYPYCTTSVFNNYPAFPNVSVSAGPSLRQKFMAYSPGNKPGMILIEF